MKWQPIETAPRDGSYFLACNGGSGASWVAHYKPVYTSGYRPENPWPSVMLNHRHCRKNASRMPTHWMPLPEPPEVTE